MKLCTISLEVTYFTTFEALQTIKLILFLLWAVGFDMPTLIAVKARFSSPPAPLIHSGLEMIMISTVNLLSPQIDCKDRQKYN